MAKPTPKAVRTVVRGTKYVITKHRYLASLRELAKHQEALQTRWSAKPSPLRHRRTRWKHFQSHLPIYRYAAFQSWLLQSE